MRILMLNVMALMCCGPAFAAQPAPTAIALPAPDQLIQMTLEDRLIFYRGLASLPPSEKDNALNALRTEIDGMSPEQKQLMQDRFQSEYASLPAAQQARVKRELQAMGR